jgi:hypothetical protein
LMQLNHVLAFTHEKQREFVWNLITSSKYLTFNILREYWVACCVFFTVVSIFERIFKKNRFTRFFRVGFRFFVETASRYYVYSNSASLSYVLLYSSYIQAQNASFRCAVEILNWLSSVNYCECVNYR